MIPRTLRRAARRVGHFLRPGPAPDDPAGREQGSSWYDGLYATSGHYQCPYYQSFYYFLWAVIADRIRRAGVRRILEIGCGPGQLAALLREQGVTSYVGLDFSPQAIAMARENVPGARFVVGDARSPQIHDEVEHDAIICTEVLEHIVDDLRVVAGFRPGRRCFCSVPSFDDPSHVRHFRDAAEVVARYGPFFRDLDVATFASPRSDPHARYDFFLFEGVRNDHVIPES